MTDTSRPDQPPVIVTDSNVSLPSDITEGLPLLTVPLEIHHGGRAYQDGVDITPSDFYRLLADSQDLPTTSAPKPGAFLEAFTKAAQQSSHVICITLAASLSSTHEAAMAAQREAASVLPDTSITVLDSRNAGTAQGLIALEAARRSADGAGAAEVLAAAQRAIEEVCLYGYLETLYYVWRSGRVPRVMMWMGNLLRVKPVLQLCRGDIGMIERPRTAARAMDRLVALATEHLAGRRGRIAVMHANARDRACTLAERLNEELNPVELFVTEFTPVIGAHTGPGLVGCALQPTDQQGP